MSRPAASLPHAWPVVSAAQMQALDRYTIETLGVAGEVLMESAGRAVVETVLSRLSAGQEVLVVCGPGHNGGDGLVVARHLHQLGVPVRAALLREELSGDAALQLARARSVGVAVEGADWEPPTAGVIVDAQFGTGLARPLEGVALESVARIRHARAEGPCQVVAVDLPSGVCSDTGQVLGDAVTADATVTFGLPKRGLVFEPGRSCAGAIEVARIGIADAAPGVDLDTSLWTSQGAAAALPPRPAHGHKGSFGHALLVAGSEGKSGAAVLCATGAARVGAGLVTLACPAGLNDILEAQCIEVMTAPLPDTPERAFAAAAEEGIVALAATRQAVGLGPGVGLRAETAGLVRALAKRIDAPLVLDADGVVAFAEEPELLRARSAPTVLTPHPGEAAALLETRPAEINGDRIGAARELAARTGAIVLLKGAGSVVAEPGGPLTINATGGPALASGGTGDVLLGMLTGLLAQGAAPADAARLAAYLHGAAADRLAARRGDAGLLAGDLFSVLPETLAALRAVSTRSAPGPRLATDFPES